MSETFFRHFWQKIFPAESIDPQAMAKRTFLEKTIGATKKQSDRAWNRRFDSIGKLRSQVCWFFPHDVIVLPRVEMNVF